LGVGAYFTLSLIGEDGKVLGCATTSFTGALNDAIPYVFNVPIFCGVAAAVVCAVVAIRKKNDCDDVIQHDGTTEKPFESHENSPNSKVVPDLDSHGNLQPDRDESGNENMPGLDPLKDLHPEKGYDPNGNTQGTTPGIDPSRNPDPAGGIPRKPVQAPSIYDIIRAAQFFVTTALISLTGLPYGYRDVATKLAWAMGLPSNLSIFSVSFLSNVADDKIRKAICKMTDFCSVLIKSPVAYNSNSACIQGEEMKIPTPPINATGFTSFGKHLQVPDYNLFFVMFIAFCCSVMVALVIASLIWLLSISCEKYWK
jgi:hypothetical protein